MHMLLLPSGEYLNLASLARTHTLANDYLTVVYLDGVNETFGPTDAKAILEALDATRLKVANRKRS